MARNIILSRRDWVREPGVVFYNGSWTSLANIADPNPQLVAEAADNTTASTKFAIDLLAIRRIGALFFANLRSTSFGTMRITASDDGSTYTYDSGVIACWPADSLAGGANPWGVTTPTGRYNAEFYATLGFSRVIVPNQAFTARYLVVEITDTLGIAPLQIGRFGACEIWQAPRNLQFGWSVTVLDESEIQTVPGGSTYITPRGLRRRMSFGLAAIDQSEFIARQLDLTMVLGQRTPMLVVPFPDAGGDIEKTAIYGRISRDPEITNPFFARYAQTFQIDQLI